MEEGGLEAREGYINSLMAGYSQSGGIVTSSEYMNPLESELSNVLSYSTIDHSSLPSTSTGVPTSVASTSDTPSVSEVTQALNVLQKLFNNKSVLSQLQSQTNAQNAAIPTFFNSSESSSQSGTTGMEPRPNRFPVEPEGVPIATGIPQYSGTVDAHLDTNYLQNSTSSSEVLSKSSDLLDLLTSSHESHASQQLHTDNFMFDDSMNISTQTPPIDFDFDSLLDPAFLDSLASCPSGEEVSPVPVANMTQSWSGHASPYELLQPQQNTQPAVSLEGQGHSSMEQSQQIESTATDTTQNTGGSKRDQMCQTDILPASCCSWKTSDNCCDESCGTCCNCCKCDTESCCKKF